MTNMTRESINVAVSHAKRDFDYFITTIPGISINEVGTFIQYLGKRLDDIKSKSLCKSCVFVRKNHTFTTNGPAQCLRCSENYDLLFAEKEVTIDEKDC